MIPAIDVLRSFDRKERFAVLRESLGFDAEAPRLNGGFQERLSTCVGVAVPDHAWLAMDYHLDWLEMGLYLAERGEIPDKTPFRNEHFPDINRNQQDVDLLMAFKGRAAGEATTHVVLIEAKAYLGWNNAQLEEKAVQLRAIFGEEGTCRHGVTPHFVLMTAKRSRQISTESRPAWMTRRGQPLWRNPTPQPTAMRKADRASPQRRRTPESDDGKAGQKPQAARPAPRPALDSGAQGAPVPPGSARPGARSTRSGAGSSSRTTSGDPGPNPIRSG